MSPLIFKEEKMASELRKLAAWANSRAEGKHHPDTTMVILRRKVLEIEERVEKAGRTFYK